MLNIPMTLPETIIGMHKVAVMPEAGDAADHLGRIGIGDHRCFPIMPWSAEIEGDRECGGLVLTRP